MTGLIIGSRIAWVLGLLALMLAMLGAFGVFASMVEERRREIGVRMALGARDSQVVRLIVHRAARPVLGGLAAGMALSLIVTPLLRRSLYGMSPFDTIAYLQIAGILRKGAARHVQVPHRPSRGPPVRACGGMVVGCPHRVRIGVSTRDTSDTADRSAVLGLSTSFSELPGAFAHSDNLVSNELHFVHAIRMLDPMGGVYIGVGPEQNFSYIARLRPAMAFVIDIRQENRSLHLTYKALFELSADRADFVSRLFSRERPAGLGPKTSVRELFTK